MAGEGSIYYQMQVLESIFVPCETVTEKHNDLSLFTQMDNSGTSKSSIVNMETSSNDNDNEYYSYSVHHCLRNGYAFDILKTNNEYEENRDCGKFVIKELFPLVNREADLDLSDKLNEQRIDKTPQQRLKLKKSGKGPRPQSS
ncbi:hypothetical protein FXO38_09337 [Capsicum annuum]|uniref:Uncharacterized protein n=1 Tax=Capsicum annuum TaxID=4072 RepID=A0A2G2YME9_CAPAN|nr:hypothetical protein FXO38_09337 [Capsicum annuum]KAF3668472.1 hypothetical protein FXO37_09535 [Capsicum annuum]PHT70933.1 hypothetical protein T459_26037 [Capsicum annuum]